MLTNSERNATIWLWFLAGLVVFVSYGIVLGLWAHIETLLPSVYDSLLPEFRPAAGLSFKREVIAYLVFQVAFSGVLAIWWATKFLPFGIPTVRLPKWLPIGLMLITLGASLFLDITILRFVLTLAAGCFLIAAGLLWVPDRIAGVTSGFWGEPREPQRRYHPALVAFLIVLVACGSAYLLIPGWQAWYPLVLSNDYFEVPDTFSILSGGAQVAVPRDLMAQCLGYTGSLSNCPVNITDAEVYRSTFERTFQWQVLYNRTLYHHSYMFVPAQHFIAHGFDRSVLFLYGYGNTILHGVAMWVFGGGLGGYFSAYPVLLLAGVLSIALCSAYMTRSLALGVLAFGMALTLLYRIDFQDASISAGFSPARYVGLCAQLASVFFALRGGSRQLIALPIAASFSLFWNFEFAAFGLVAQGLAVMAPSIQISIFKRALLMALMLVLPVIYLLLSKIDGSIIQVTPTQFFQIGMPEERPGLLIMVMVKAAAVQIAALALCFTFKGAERYARLAILPAIMLIVVKFIFNPAGQHMNFSLLFMYPIMLAYLPTIFYRPSKIPAWALGAVGFLVLGVLFGKVQANGNYYLQRSNEVRGTFTAHMVPSTWSDLQDKIVIAAPSDFIVDRVAAIQAEIGPDDALLSFSPFGHLLAFYEAPKRFCGQFELLSSLILDHHVEQVRNCVSTAENLLVVHDAKLLEPCPDWPISNNCEVKQRMTQRANNVFTSMLPSLVEVAKSGDLKFYRPNK